MKGKDMNGHLTFMLMKQAGGYAVDVCVAMTFIRINFFIIVKIDTILIAHVSVGRVGPVDSLDGVQPSVRCGRGTVTIASLH
jgi:hypothetical protein